MNGNEIGELARVVLVIAIVIAAAALATPRGRLPLALRGVMKIMRRDRGLSTESAQSVQPVSKGRRLFAFALVVVAFLLAGL